MKQTMKDKGQQGDGTGEKARQEIERLLDGGGTFAAISRQLKEIGQVNGNDVTRAPSTISSIDEGAIENPPEELVEALSQISIDAVTKAALPDRVVSLAKSLREYEKKHLVISFVRNEIGDDVADAVEDVISALKERR